MHSAHLETPWGVTETRSRILLRGDIECDVTVVGGGITGLTAAYLLQQQGHSVVVVEALRIGGGTSGATTAHLTTDCDHDYTVLKKSYGTDSAALVKRSLEEAIGLIESLTQKLQIACDFRRLPGFLYTEDEGDVGWIEEELEVFQEIGLVSSRTDTVPLPFATKMGIELAAQAAFHPLRYLHGLAAAFENLGGRIFTGSSVRDFKGGAPCLTATDYGKVRSKYLILATHTPLGISPLQTVLAPYRSFAACVKTTASVPDALFWDTAEPYNYIRRLDANDPHTLIIGGQDRKTAHGEETASFEALRAYIGERFSDATVTALWSAQFYDPADHVPFIGSSPIGKNVYVATGFSGDGMTFGSLAGHMIAEQIQGRRTPYDELYKPARVRTAGLKDFLLDQIDVARCMIGDRLTKKPTTLADIGRGEGAVLKVGNDRLAAYRDESGKLSTCSAVCPHLGGIVRWNKANTSFDCPCHGSRFDTQGEPLEGPSMRALEKISGSFPKVTSTFKGSHIGSA